MSPEHRPGDAAAEVCAAPPAQPGLAAPPPRARRQRLNEGRGAAALAGFVEDGDVVRTFHIRVGAWGFNSQYGMFKKF